MRNYKRFTAFLCCAVMLLSAGCAEEEQNNNAGSSGESISESSAETYNEGTEKEDPKKKKNNKKDDDAEVIFSEPAGFYAEPFELELSPKRNYAKIYYTTDGSIPTENSTPYTGPITLNNRSDEPNAVSAHTDITVGEAMLPSGKVNKANIIRAAAFGDSGMIGEVVTCTYFVGLDREKLYGDAPVVSLVTPEEGLFSYENGIYVTGKAHDDFLSADPKNKMVEPWHQEANFTQRGKEWERATSFEFFTDGEEDDFSQLMGLRIMGAASRNECQKSMRLTAREEYGKKNVKHEIIPDNQRSDGTGKVEKYKSFVLRNGGNDCHGTKFRDPLIQNLVTGRAFDTLQTQPVVVYLNGEYWGLYTLTEDYSDNYIENNYGIDNKNVIIIKRGDVEEGDETDSELFTEMYDYIVNNDMSDAANYEKASEMLDMQGFADLCALNVYTNNDDGLFQNNNYRFWRVRTPDNSCEQADGKWRVLVYDTEFSTGVYDGGQSADFDTVAYAVGGVYKEDKELKEPPSKMFLKLLENESFKDMFIMSLCDMRNICFNKTHAKAEIDKFASKYKPLVKESNERYGYAYEQFEWGLWGLENFMNTRYDKFMKMITDNFGDMKKAEVDIMKTEGGKILVNSVATDPAIDIKTSYFTKYPLSFTAVPDEGKKFVEWRYIGNCNISDEASADITIELSGDLSITAVFE